VNRACDLVLFANVNQHTAMNTRYLHQHVIKT